MRYLLRAILAGGLGFAVSLLIAACGGGSGLLSSDQASTLTNQLHQISTAFASGDCAGVSSAATGLNGLVGNLPSTVSATLRNNLIQGASTVSELAQQECRQHTSSPAVATQSTSTPTTTSTAATTSSTAAQTTSSTTAPPPPTTSTTSSTPATTTTNSGTTPTGGTGGAGLGAAGGKSNGGPAVNTPGTGGK